MIPSTVLGLVLTLASISPGYVYIRYAAKKRPRVEKTNLLELGEFLIAGTLSSLGGVLSILLLGRLGVPLAIDLSDWAEQGTAYLAADPWPVLSSALAAFVIALLVARLAAWFLHRGRDSVVSDLPVWWNVLGDRPKGHEVFCSATMDSGRIVEGFLFAHTTPGDAEPREIALKPPLFLWQEEERFRVFGVDRVIIPASRIVEIAVRYVRSEE